MCLIDVYDYREVYFMQWLVRLNFDLLCSFLSSSAYCYIKVAAIDYEVVSWQVFFYLMSIDMRVFF